MKPLARELAEFYHDANSYQGNHMSVEAIIEKAISEERERCAKVAEAHECEDCGEQYGEVLACEPYIAAAIRKDPDETPN